MTENLRTISGYVVISQQLLNQAIATEQAIARHEHLLLTDPEYAAEWSASVDWDLIEESYEDDR